MFSGNFRVLIFIDLLATAMGGSLILMMILSISRAPSAAPVGAARAFIMYKVWADDPEVLLKIVVKNGDNGTWLNADIPERNQNATDPFSLHENKQTVFVWGPVDEFDEKGKITRNVYTVYSTAAEKGRWTLGALYYNHATLNAGKIKNMNELKATLYHELRTIQGESKDTVVVTLGNYSFLTVDINPIP